MVVSDVNKQHNNNLKQLLYWLIVFEKSISLLKCYIV